MSIKPPEAFCIDSEFIQNPTPRYDNKADFYKEGSLVWQPHVYDLAGYLLDTFKCNTLIDVGCGNAHKLIPYMEVCNIIGIDYGPNIQFCKDRYKGKWIEQDLEESFYLEVPEDSIIICADVIEHLMDPDNILKSLVGKGKVLLISTPDRKGKGPPQRAHVREWTTGELNNYLSKFFNVTWIGLTKSHNKSGFFTSLAIVSKVDLPEIPKEWAIEK